MSDGDTVVATDTVRERKRDPPPATPDPRRGKFNAVDLRSLVSSGECDVVLDSALKDARLVRLRDASMSPLSTRNTLRICPHSAKGTGAVVFNISTGAAGAAYTADAGVRCTRQARRLQAQKQRTSTTGAGAAYTAGEAVMYSTTGASAIGAKATYSARPVAQSSLPVQSSCGPRQGHEGVSERKLHSLWSFLECAALAVPRSVGPRFPGLAAIPQRTIGPFLEVCGSWPLHTV